MPAKTQRSATMDPDVTIDAAYSMFGDATVKMTHRAWPSYFVELHLRQGQVRGLVVTERSTKSGPISATGLRSLPFGALQDAALKYLTQPQEVDTADYQALKRRVRKAQGRPGRPGRSDKELAEIVSIVIIERSVPNAAKATGYKMPSLYGQLRQATKRGLMTAPARGSIGLLTEQGHAALQP